MRCACLLRGVLGSWAACQLSREVGVSAFMHVRTSTDALAELQNQTEQTIVLMPVAAGSPGSATKLVRASGESPDGPRTVRHGNKQYLIPGISVSLAKKLGEAVMKSRISYEYRDESGKNDSGHAGGEGGEVGKHGDNDGVDEEEGVVDEEEDYP